jgi:cytochrome c oxidase subunit 3
MDDQTTGSPPAARGAEEQKAQLAGTLGMSLFIIVVSMLFAASVIAYLIVRLRHPEWDNPPLPVWIYVSTFLIIGSGMTMQLSLGSFRVSRVSLGNISLLATLILAVLYLLSQLMAWSTLVRSGVFAESSLYAFSFYMLTVLHAIHVLGGLFPMTTMTLAAYRGRYGSGRSQPVKYMAMYWHCLGIVWLVLFAVLLATT